MKDEHETGKLDSWTENHEVLWDEDGEDYIWATTEEAKRDALSLSRIGSIVHKHGGTVHLEPETDSIHIDVPEDKKLACAEELSQTEGTTLP